MNVQVGVLVCWSGMGENCVVDFAWRLLGFELIGGWVASLGAVFCFSVSLVVRSAVHEVFENMAIMW